MGKTLKLYQLEDDTVLDEKEVVEAIHGIHEAWYASQQGDGIFPDPTLAKTRTEHFERLYPNLPLVKAEGKFWKEHGEPRMQVLKDMRKARGG